MKHLGDLEVTATFTARQIIVQDVNLFEAIKLLEKRIERLEKEDSSEQEEPAD